MTTSKGRQERSLEQLTQDFTRKMDRQWVLEMLRDKHGLSFFEISGRPPEEVRRRQAAYKVDLAFLREKWAREDEEREKEAQKVP